MRAGQHVILMGVQGAGKGTQAERLAPILNLEHLSTGEAFRNAIASQTDLGVVAKRYLDSGELVPDEITLGIVAAKLDSIASDTTSERRYGALFDGFPRTVSQAAGLASQLESRGQSIVAVVEISVPRQELIERLSGRRVCPVCGAVYHNKFNPPIVEGQCDREGATLEQRADDTAEAISRRLSIYFEMTEPVLKFYRDAGLLETVNGLQSIERVQEDILALVTGPRASEEQA